MIKKFSVVLLLAALVALPFLGVTAPVRAQGQTLGLSLSTLNNPFFVTLRDGAQKAADELGVKLVVVDAQDKPETEAKNLEDLIAQKVNAILVNPTDGDAIVPSIEAANKAGIPVFTVDRGANGGQIVSHIASDNVLGGKLAAQLLCKKIGGKGKVIELEGIAGTSAARDRGAGFNAFMKEGCSGAEIVAKQTANFNRAEGLKVFENILQAQPEIAGVFAHNDEMILGAVEAAKAAKREGIVFVGFDATDDAVASVKGGSLMGTIAQQPALMGDLAVRTAVAALKGEKPAESIPVPVRVVQKLTIGLSLSTLNNPFFVTLRDGAQKAADSYGTVTLVVVDAQDKSETEAKNLEDLIAQKVDAILVNPTDSDAIVPSIEAANKAGIPVFTVDRGASGGEIVSHIASDNVAGGALAAQYLCEALGGKGKVVELEGIAGTSAARDRGAGFNAYMKEKCAGVEIVAKQTANFNRAEGLKVFENILQAQPEINGVFAHNDEMVLGAIEAAKAAKREGIIFVGFDAVDDAVKAVADGTLAATVAQQPGLIGEIGVHAAVGYLGFGEPAKSVPVGLSLVKK